MTDLDLPATAVILTKVAVPEGLAAACAMSKIPIDAVPTAIGAVAVCRSTGIGDPETAAQVISQMLSNTPVVLLTQRDGQMTAARWADGKQDEELSPALMLDGAPPEVEQLLLGQLSASELPGVVTSAGMSRWKAMRILAAAAKAGRKR
ncbi:hypothetical protein [Cellulomonas sp. KRMCY2]|uniref:hypothetical protein n=1 Tax=Cellulomonas sp. KRMCY2 TaxID=1304865 RepID=UPI00045E92B7|nr:hypothetical protein [Cellulomonas sp. KRMCY2]